MRKLLLLVCLPVAFFGFGRAVSAEVAADNINVEQKPVESNQLCVYPSIAVATSAMRYTYATSDKDFVLEITLDRPLCYPVEASATIYSMPGNGVAWPQTLKQAEKFTLKNAGTTKVTFLKDCDPVQFDVVTGETPETITPLTAPMLLFPFDIKTAEQWWGCPPPSTTTTTVPVTTTTVPATTTTVPRTTTTTVATTTTQPKPVASPLPLVVEPPKPEIGEAATLANTGTTSIPLALFGIGLVVAGTLLVRIRRTVTNGKH